MVLSRVLIGVRELAGNSQQQTQHDCPRVHIGSLNRPEHVGHSRSP
jgi:hypothetical protein